MEYEEIFKFLNFEQMNRKNANDLPVGEKTFLILNLLDNKNNPCRFFIFNKDLMNKIINSNFVGLQDLYIKFAVVYSNNMWNVKVLEIN